MEVKHSEVETHEIKGWKIALALLLALELIAAVILSTRLVVFSDFRRNFIALRGGSSSQIMSTYDKADQAGSTNFVVRDDVQVWTTDTKIELFKFRFDNNGDLTYTVETGADDKVMAPGTSNAYTFTLGNPDADLVDYTLELEAWQDVPEDMFIPLKFRMYDDAGSFFVGDETTWEKSEALNGVSLSNSLEGGRSRSYTLEWYWPFEGGIDDDVAVADAYDTMLGNYAANTGDLIQHVTIRTMAQVSKTGEPERNWAGGAAWALVNLICMILTDIIAVVEVIKYIRGKKEQPAEPEYVDEGKVVIPAAEYVANTEEKDRKRERVGWKLFEIVPFLFGTILFFLTENMRLPMILVDKWTILMVVTLLIAITLALLTRQRDPEEEPDEDDQEAPKE